MSDTRVYANAMWHYARGMAYARKNQISGSRQELQKLVSIKSNPQLKESPSPFNPGLVSVEVAEKILQGIIAEQSNQNSAAITILQEAVNMEDNMLYNEPRDWILPARQYLGNVLLKSKQFQQAEKVYREDLLVNPNNGWSLTGLEKALRNQNKNQEAATVQQQAKKALARADIKVTGSVF